MFLWLAPVVGLMCALPVFAVSLIWLWVTLIRHGGSRRWLWPAVPLFVSAVSIVTAAVIWVVGGRVSDWVFELCGNVGVFSALVFAIAAVVAPMSRPAKRPEDTHAP